MAGKPDSTIEKRKNDFVAVPINIGNGRGERNAEVNDLGYRK
jgi:hypothetical protein